MRINGIEMPLIHSQNLQDFLLSQGYDLNRIAVERNAEIVPKGTYETVQLCDSDIIEIITFMGGG